MKLDTHNLIGRKCKNCSYKQPFLKGILLNSGIIKIGDINCLGEEK